MSRCTFYLVSLKGPVSDFKASLATIPNKPLYVGKVHRWVLPPKVYPLGKQAQASWDVLLFFSGSVELSEQTKALIDAEWRLEADAPPPMLDAFAITNQRLSHPKPEDIPLLTGKWERTPETDPDTPLGVDYSPELREWVRSFGTQVGKKAALTFNLVSYDEDKRDVYMKYVEGFGIGAGKTVGAEVMIFGEVKSCSSTPSGEKQWEVTALVHYPSIRHLGEMLASEEYRKLDAAYFYEAVRDAGIMCLTEFE